MLPTIDQHRNPLMCEDGCHVATARLALMDGRVYQLFTPADWSTHSPEWRPLPDYTDIGAGADKPAVENPPA